ncbi:hypothetical protein [Longispora fulva]|uniref:Uncharacterized protein n=2 Tax=Longispora fulva TaxID=619741 RepID=A0A8J7G7W6_9ACTN|nr:hypothetical protein [Longispora fulva]
MMGRLATVVLLAGAGLVAAVSGAGAAPPAATVAVAPVFDLNGPWTDNGSARPSIINNGVNLVVNMNYAGRPTAFGTVRDATTIVVRFPDAGTFTARLEGTGIIRWSNGSTWQKVFNGPLVHDINGPWTDGASDQSVSNQGGYLRVVFRNGRPDGVGFAVNPTTIVVTFPDNATYAGRVDPAGLIVWSNNTVWRHPILR